jgi:hypothetical protein
MENAVVLREWFDRVDAAHTGNITAPQLQVCLPPPPRARKCPDEDLATNARIRLPLH